MAYPRHGFSGTYHEGLPGDRELERRMTNMNFENCKASDLPNFFECPVCLEYCFPPSYICERGHLVCGSCITNGIDSCPFCRSKNLQLSKELSTFLQRCGSFSCVFEDFGCKVKTNGLSIKEHEASCLHARIPCPLKLCTTKIAINDLQAHVMEEHFEKCYKFSASVTINLGEDPDQSVIYFTGFSEMITFNFQQNGHGILAKATFLEPVESREDIFFQVVFEKGMKTTTWRGKVLGATNQDEVDNIFKSSFRAVKDFVHTKENKLMLSACVSVMKYSGDNIILDGGCSHYNRGCYLICPETSCNAIVPCRICHDERIKGHKFNRFGVREVKCISCGYPQTPRKNCLACKSVFGKYFCNICNLFDNENDSSVIFHCVKCGICRKRADASIEYTHCDICGICIVAGDGDHHECKRLSAMGLCFVCKKDKFTSRSEIMPLRCGHYIHRNCRDNVQSRGLQLICLDCDNSYLCN